MLFAASLPVFLLSLVKKSLPPPDLCVFVCVVCCVCLCVCKGFTPSLLYSPNYGSAANVSASSAFI